MVKWTKCGEATLHGPGLIWYWDLVTEHELVDMRWRSIIMHVQSVTMTDGTSVSARAMTLWRPSDPLAAVGENEDFPDRVGETSLSCVADVLSGLGREQLKVMGALNATLTLETRAQLDECGVEVKRCKFTELVVSPAFRIINDAG